MVTTLTKHKLKQTEIGLIPSDWGVRTLGECCFKITDGTHDTPIQVKTGIPFLTAIHVKENNIDFIGCYYLPENVHRAIYNRCNPEKEDVLMVNIGAGVATTALVNVDYEFSLKNVALLKPNNTILIGAFLNYWQIQSKSKIINSIVTGGAQPFLALNQIGNLRIPLPPLPEQQAIATVLSDTDNLINALQKLITKKQNIKQGIMQQLLKPKKDWEVKRLGELGECIIGLTYTPNDVKESGKLVLRSSNVQGASLKYDNNVFVDCDVSERLINRENDILICVRNGSKDLIGKCALIKERAIGETFGAFMAIFRSPYNNYIFHLFQSFIIKKQIDEHLGATINQITNKSLNSFEIPFPSLEEQTHIATILSDMDNELQGLQLKLDKYKQLKQGLMQQLLSGKIRLI